MSCVMLLVNTLLAVSIESMSSPKEGTWSVVRWSKPQNVLETENKQRSELSEFWQCLPLRYCYSSRKIFRNNSRLHEFELGRLWQQIFESVQALNLAATADRISDVYEKLNIPYSTTPSLTVNSRLCDLCVQHFVWITATRLYQSL